MAATAMAIAPPRRVDIAGTEHTIDRSTLGGRMAWARVRRNMTQQALADAIPNMKDGVYTGTSKSRATINQYEKDNIQPPLDVVLLIAEQLKVSPSYIAYGEHTTEGLSHHQESEMISFPAIKFGIDGPYVADTLAFSKSKVDELGVDQADIKGYVLPNAAPHFGLEAGDTAIVDAAVTERNSEDTLYALKAGNSIEIVSIDQIGIKEGKAVLRITGGGGQEIHRALDKLTFLGAVISTIRS